jgi:5'-nucleotidase
MENIIIPDRDKLEKTKENIKKDGLDKIHVLADFDRTLIKAFVDGESVPSLISVLYNQNYLTSEYGSKAQELDKKYRTIEFDPKIPKQEKKKAMYEWWTLHFDLLIKSGLNKKDLKSVVKSGKIKFREGFLEFIDFLKANDIPLVIMSSSGLGCDPIAMCLEREGRLYRNIHIISNSFEWDKNGRALAVKQPIIYGMNKDETLIQDFPAIFEEVKNRKNIILLGDSLDDVGMVTGFDYGNLIKIGFLNDRVGENLENYKKTFDVVITNDGSLNFVNQLLK